MKFCPQCGRSVDGCSAIDKQGFCKFTNRDSYRRQGYSCKEHFVRFDKTTGKRLEPVATNSVSPWSVHSDMPATQSQTHHRRSDY